MEKVQIKNRFVSIKLSSSISYILYVSFKSLRSLNPKKSLLFLFLSHYHPLTGSSLYFFKNKIPINASSKPTISFAIFYTPVSCKTIWPYWLDLQFCFLQQILLKVQSYLLLLSILSTIDQVTIWPIPFINHLKERLKAAQMLKTIAFLP